jgi:SAM-dependent methyltransferase
MPFSKELLASVQRMVEENRSKEPPKANPVAFYDQKYADGGWKYNLDKETKDLNRITTAVGLKPGDTMLEVGCGSGFHSMVLHKLGFQVVGSDLSRVGIEFAREHYQGPTYIWEDTAVLMERLPTESFDGILVRGHSWWHYDLTECSRKKVNVPMRTRQLFSLLKPGGVFILAIRTDFSGKEYADGVLNNTYQAYLDLFAPLGTIVYVADAAGTLLFDDAAARQSGNNIVIATRRKTA